MFPHSAWQLKQGEKRKKKDKEKKKGGGKGEEKGERKMENILRKKKFKGGKHLEKEKMQENSETKVIISFVAN